MIVCETVNPHYSKIYSDNDSAKDLEALLRLAERFAIRKSDYQFMPAYKAGRWDGRIRFFNAATGFILTGLLPKAYAELRRIYSEVEFRDTRGYFTESEVIEIDPEMFVDTEFGNVLFDDQIFAAKNLLKRKRAVGEIATGFGKTVLCAAMFEYVQPKCGLLIVPTTDLIIQTYSDFHEFGLEDKVSMYGGGVKEKFGQYVIATWQTLMRTPDIMENFDMIIIDETHGAKAVEIQNLMEKAVNAEYRYGVTGTLPKDKVDLATIEGILGPTTVVIEASDLQAIGRLTQCQIIQVHFDYSKDVLDDIKDHVKNIDHKPTARKEKLYFLAGYEPRAEKIRELISALEGSAVVLVNYAEEGKALEKVLPNSMFIDKDVKGQKRKEIRARLEDPNDPLTSLICTYHLGSTGLNMKSLKYIVFASPSKSFIRVIQSIGRLLRKFLGKHIAFLIDIVDKVPGIESGKERNKYYLEKKYPTQEISVELE